MKHLHDIIDSDNGFYINPITRAITNESGKVKLVQNDHNSERFTFEIPRLVDGHDMSLCDKIEVHYINISGNSTDKSEDVYLVEDAQIGEGSTDAVIFSWLISANATKYAGTLNFLIRFVCLDGDKVEYAWNTDIFKSINIASGMNNGEAVIAEYSDVLEVWKAEVLAEANAVLERVTAEAEGTQSATEKAEAAAERAETAATIAESTVEHITPEMFGAKGDGVTDDTAAVVSALETGKTVLLENTYLINTITPPMAASIVVNGKLIVKGTINICYPDIKFTGTGTVRCDGSVCFTLKGAGDTDTTYCKNFYAGHELTVDGYINKDCTAFLITAENGKKGVVVYPEINCKIRMFKYGIHSMHSGTDNSWFTSLRCRSLFENCLYAVIFDWHGTGSVLDVVVQPLVVDSDDIHTDGTPLIKVGNNCTVTGIVWDIGTAQNKYAVYVEGEFNTVDIGTDDKYIFCAKPFRNNLNVKKQFYFDVSTAYQEGNANRPTLMPYNNTNDIAINAGNNKVGLSVTPTSYAGAVKNLLARAAGNQSMTMYVANTAVPDGLAIEFAFPSAVALRQIFVSGEKLPETVKFEFKNTSDEWVELKTCVLGTDYENKNGAENYAWWQFKFDYYAGMEFTKRFAKGVRITMNIETKALISRIHIGTTDVYMPNKLGDDLVATSFKIKGTDGKYYNVTVSGGTLVATAET